MSFSILGFEQGARWNLMGKCFMGTVQGKRKQELMKSLNMMPWLAQQRTSLHFSHQTIRIWLEFCNLYSSKCLTHKHIDSLIAPRHCPPPRKSKSNCSVNDANTRGDTCCIPFAFTFSSVGFRRRIAGQTTSFFFIHFTDNPFALGSKSSLVIARWKLLKLPFSALFTQSFVELRWKSAKR